LPRYDPKKNYFESYWRIYLKNEQLLQDINSSADERDQILKSILHIEQFFNNDENLEQMQRERYISGRKKHNRRCANEIKR